MSMQKNDLTFEEILTARTIFAKHAEGKIKSVHQLRGILSDLGQYPSQAELDTVLDSFAHKLRFEDFARYLEFLKKSFMKPEAKDADTVRAFVALGGSHDRHGNIIADDLRSACRKFNLTIDIDAMLLEVDEDGSGSIDYSEFRAMWEKEEGAVTFQTEDDTQSEAEYLAVLRAFLTAEVKDAESNAQFHRTHSKVRKQSTRNLSDSARKSTIRLPPVNTSAALAASPAKTDNDALSESEEDDTPAKAPEPTRQGGNANDPTYRRYMMTDPVVVGSRRSAKPTPRGLASATVTPRAHGTMRAGSSHSPKRSTMSATK